MGSLKAAVIWIGHFNRVASTRKVSQVFNNYPQGSRLRGRPKKEMVALYTKRH